MLLVDLKMPHLPHLRIKQFSQQKNPPKLLSIYWALASCKKSQKSNEPILRKGRYWRKDGQKGRLTEFLGPCRRAGGRFKWDALKPKEKLERRPDPSSLISQ